MREDHPEAARELEEEIRMINEQLVRLELAIESGRGPDCTPPRLPGELIPAHIRGMSHSTLQQALDRLTRDLEDAQRGWDYEKDRQ